MSGCVINSSTLLAKEVKLKPNELKKFLLAKDKDGHTAWHRAANEGNLEDLGTLWSWAKEAGMNSEKFLLAKSVKGYTTWEIAMQGRHFEILQRLWV